MKDIEDFIPSHALWPSLAPMADSCLQLMSLASRLFHTRGFAQILAILTAFNGCNEPGKGLQCVLVQVNLSQQLIEFRR